MKAEIELWYADQEFPAIALVEVASITELANRAYQMQIEGGYRKRVVKKVNGAEKTVIVGLQIENVTFGQRIERDDNGMPDYQVAKRR